MKVNANMGSESPNAGMRPARFCRRREEGPQDMTQALIHCYYIYVKSLLWERLAHDNGFYQHYLFRGQQHALCTTEEVSSSSCHCQLIALLESLLAQRSWFMICMLNTSS